MKSILEFFVKYKIWANAIIFVVFALGIMALVNIKSSSFPIEDSTLVQVSVAYPGASPQEVEEGIVIKIEQALQGIEGIKEVTSISRENIGSVNVEIYSNYSIDELVSEVKNAVDRINSFPVGAENPLVFEVKQTDLVGSLVLRGNIPLSKLKEYADKIEDDLLQKKISQVDIQGLPDLEISIEVSEDALRLNRLTFDDVANAVRRNNNDVSAGSIKTTDEEVLIRSNAKEYEANKIESIILRSNADGSQVLLGEVAKVKEQFADDPNKSIYNGQNAVGINVSKLPDEDLIAIIKEVYQYIDDFNTEHPDAELLLAFDNSENLKDRLNLLIENGGVGLILVVITLGIFLSLRLSGWVAFGIPFSFAGMFFAYSLMGGTINLISLFGMILVIGILVDDGIVIAENVYSHFERGKSPMRAAIDGSAEILPSVFASVLTTVMLFLIFFTAEGRFGLITQTIATVVILTLLFSLVEAVLILPAHLSERSVLSGGRDKKPKNGFQRASQNVRNSLEKGIYWLRDKMYEPFLRRAIRNRYVYGLIPILFIMIVTGLLAGRHIKFTFFPIIPRDNVEISLVLAAGTRENITEEKLRDIADDIWGVNQVFKQSNGIDSLITDIRLTIGTGGGETGSHTGSINVDLADSRVRGSISDDQIANAIRKQVGEIPEAKKFIVGGARFFGRPVSLSLRSTNLEELKAFKEELKAELKNITDLRDVVDNDIIGTREVQLDLKPRAYALGLTRQEIARQVRQGFFGEEVQRLQKGKNEMRVWVRYTDTDRSSIGKLEEMRIKTPQGQEYPLIDLVDYDIDRSIVNINHLDGAREIRVEADIINVGVSVPDILAQIRTEILPPLQAKYSSVSITEEGQAQESAEIRGKLMGAFPLAFAGMLLLVTLVFRSLPQALMMIPMILVGVFSGILGHGIEDILQGPRMVPVSILSVFGILALMGVIVNDTVVFLNKFNLLIKDGYNIKKAVYEAGLQRFRPILLTSITTVVGLYPIIFEKSFQAEFLKPLAISMAYGVLLGTAFILVCFPAYILIVNDIRRGWTYLVKGVWKRPEEVEPAYEEERKLVELEE